MATDTTKKRRPSTEQELEIIRQEAREEGFTMGYEDGHYQGLQVGKTEGFHAGQAQGLQEARDREAAALAAFLAELDEMGARVQEAVRTWSAEAEAKVAELAIDAVRRVLDAELHLNRDAIHGIVAQALGQVTRGGEAVIRVNPFDMPIVEQRREALLVQAATLQKIMIVADPTIHGGCVIETPAGVVDAQLDTQMALLEQSIQEAA